MISLGSEFQNHVADTWKVPAPSDSLLYFGQIKFKDPYLLCLSVEHISILKPTVTMNYVVCCCQSWYGDSLSIMLWWQPTNLEKQKHLTQLITVALSWEVPVDDQQQWKPYFLVAIDLSRLLYLLKLMPRRWLNFLHLKCTALSRAALIWGWHLFKNWTLQRNLFF